MKPSLQLRIGQNLNMTPQLQQAIRLLQLSSLDLQQEIQSAVEKNPMLELGEQDESQSSHIHQTSQTTADNASNLSSTNDTPAETTESQAQDISTNVENPTNEHASQIEVGELDRWDVQTHTRNKTRSDSSSGNEIERLTSEETTLKDHLIWQMQLTPFSPTDYLIAMTLIDAINEDGYLVSTIEDLHDSLKEEGEIDIDELYSVLHRIQQFDPIGVGSQTLSECLSIQLKKLPQQHPWRQKAIDLVTHHLPLLAKRDYAALRRHLQLSLEELKCVIKCIQMQHPRPGRKIGSSTSEYIVPDVYVRKHGNKWVVALNPECAPPVTINQNYASLIRRSDSSRDNQFLKTQLQEARWFLKSIENRNETLIKVTECIVESQSAFFEEGDIAMKPLILHQVAEKVGMHESTISRITTQKFMHTPRGTFELKYFFSSHVGTSQGGECSATAIRAFIKKLVDDENKKKPLSDEKIAKLLSEDGIKVARRTVAKYRESLKIPPSNERKRIF